LEAREDGPEVVADSGQHRRALFDLAFYALAHLHEGYACPAALLRASRAEIRHGAPLAAVFRSLRERQDRLDLVAQERHRDHQKDERGSDHPDEEDMRVGRIGLATADEDTQDLVFKLDTHLDDVRVTDGIEPEGPSDLPGNFRRQRLIEK